MMQKKTWWTGKRVAHIFEDGWSTASYQRKLKPAEAKEMGDDFVVFHYADMGDQLTHNLKLEEWGITKSWVVLQKKTTANT